MSEIKVNVVIMRAQISALPLEDARTRLYALMRRAVRARLMDRAKRFDIMDYDDALLVEDHHRVFRDNIVNIATGYVSQVQAATTIEDLLVVYDEISIYL